MSFRRCKATTVIHGEVVRCDGIEDHDSVHFGDGHWWPNKNGFPYEDEKSHYIVAYMVWAVGILATGVAIYLILR